MMIRKLCIVTTLLAGLAMFLPAGVSNADESDNAEIKSVVSQQLAAFQRDDAALAYSFATPKIQSIFGSPENFLSMVRTGYLPVYRPRNVTFLDIVMMRGQHTQRVLLTGPDGAETVAYYFMEKQPDGRWLIDGCVLSEPEDLSV